MTLRKTPAPSGERTQIWSIQYLRAAAATAVLTYHQLGNVSMFHLRPFQLGQYGVDLFFVISGFIMVALTSGRSIGPQRFILDRVTRIAPTYWLATLAAFILAVLKFPFYAGSGDIILFTKSLFFIPSYNRMGNIWPTLFLGWTLNYEMFFYVIFSIALFLNKRTQLAALTAVFILLMIIGFIFAPKDAIAATYTSPRLAEFLAGAWLGQIFGLSQRSYSNLVAGTMSAIIILVLLGLGTVYKPVIFGGFATFTLLLFLLLERSGKIPRIALLKFIGDASYSIYLFQEFPFDVVQFAIRKIDAKFGSHFAGQMPERLFCIVVALGFGLLVFYYVERPLTGLVRKLVLRRDRPQGLTVAV
jgi:exopolysaccharide production protein ExoZ